jgi:hypothetical protein
VSLSPGWLLSSLFLGTVGLGLFLYGKKQTRFPQLLAGIALILESTFVPSPAWMFASAVLALGALWAALRAGW